VRYSCLTRASAEQQKCDKAQYTLPLFVWRAAISPMTAYSTVRKNVAIETSLSKATA
jgi:SOS-response transcriptional repressor LexA